MASLIGITNEQDFYSQHWLDEIFSETLSEHVKAAEEKHKASEEAAKEAEGKGIKQEIWQTPWRRLGNAIFAREHLEAIRQVPSTKDVRERLAEEKRLTAELLDILGLPSTGYKDIVLENGLPIPAIAEVLDDSGSPYLWILPASAVGGTVNGDGEKDVADEDTDPLELCIHKKQLIQDGLEVPATAKGFVGKTWQEILSGAVFNQDAPPRWVILAGLQQWVLIDRAKFAHRRVLRFDWMEILSRREDDTLKAVSVLLGNEAFQVNEGACRLESLDEASHRHAYGVSDDLKYALRESIELLGNEAAKQLRQLAAEKGKGFFSGKDALDPVELTNECLRYMYRLMFLFFVESRPELKYVPVENDPYISTYSLESLRDLEMIQLTTEEDINGRYIHDSIQKLFEFFVKGTVKPSQGMLDDREVTAEAFEITPLPSTLFDDTRMGLLNQVVFPNHILQRVIELMSLSREGGKKRGRKRQRRGRISYAHLGLNQLGAVYEALLCYQGFFAQETLYEVNDKGSARGELDPAYFVTAQELLRYKDEERVYVIDKASGDRTLKKYEKGSFIYRMAGRARENSASYYTPEVLTKCLVEEALDVLVKQQLDGLPDDKAKAEKILSWKICEPAMGSAAFLNEAVNQVSELYMQHAMKVPSNPKLNQQEYQRELQKVKMYLADNNIYGVDLNPIAVELAEVSIWLNALSDDHYVPWFGTQLACGNSLIGCRREAFWSKDLRGKKWQDARPHPVPPTGLREGEIWHFLVPDGGMSNYTDKDIKKLAGDEIAIIDDWRKKFTKPFDETELCTMEKLSMTIDGLWKRWAEYLDDADKKTTDPYDIYGHPAEDIPIIPYDEKKALLEKVRMGDGSLDSGEFARLKQVMDYWCSLWFWPIDKGYELPSRAEFLRQVSAILSGSMTAPNLAESLPKTDLFEENLFTAAEEAEQGLTNLEKRARAFERRYPQLKTVNELAERYRFMHWPLRFVTVFLPQDDSEPGFDLTLGNPPWQVAKWDAGAVMGDCDPRFVLHSKEYSAKGIQDVIFGKRDVENGIPYLARHPKTKRELLSVYSEKGGSQNFFNSENLYPELKGTRTDLFKLFLPVVWNNASDDGVQALVHPDTPYTETKAILLRKAVYGKIRKHYQFDNELKELFPEVDNNIKFSLNIYGSKKKNINFESINGLFRPQTIVGCRTEGNKKPIEGQRNHDGTWNTKGHPSRILSFDINTLKLVANIFGGNSDSVILPSIYAKEFLNILVKFGDAKKRLSNFEDNVFITSLWNETTDKMNGTINEIPDNITVFPENLEDVVLNGPHIFVGHPLFKCPDVPCISNKAWHPLDLVRLPDDYLPRVKYLPNLPMEEYRSRMQETPWDRGRNDLLRKEGKTQKVKKIVDYFRLGLRSMVGADSERTLMSALLTCDMSHVNSVESIAFNTVDKLLLVAGACASLPLDFYIRQQNKMNLLPELLLGIPLPEFSVVQKRTIMARVLALNCLTKWYAPLWKEAFETDFCQENWASMNNHINQSFFHNLTADWQRNNALRTDLERRQALLELDVIVSQAFGLTLEELQTCYRLGFRVMRDYDQDTWYDQKGRIIFTPNSNGLRGVGLPRKAQKASDDRYAVNGSICPNGLGWEDVKNMETGTVSKTFMDDTLPGGPTERTITYVAPFFRKDREADYAEAWAYFEKKHATSEH